MDGVFALLWVTSLGCLVIGLARPQVFKRLFKAKTSRKVVGLTFASSLIVFFVLTGITSGAPHDAPVTTKKPSSSTVKQQQTTPTITTGTVTTTQPIAFQTTTEQDASLAKDTTSVKIQGVNGVQTQTWTVTYSNGKETGRKLVSTVTTTQPINEVVEQGTYVAVTQPTPQSPAPAPSCYPLTNGGNCYEPGEYCRTSDRGASGVAGNGESITCKNNNGWRWEPS